MFSVVHSMMRITGHALVKHAPTVKLFVIFFRGAAIFFHVSFIGLLLLLDHMSRTMCDSFIIII